jgi:hypothetical protein
MSILISETPASCKQYTYSCLFEHAEHLLDAWLHGRKRSAQDDVMAEIIALQEASSLTSEAALKKAVSLKRLQHRVRPALLLQKELVEACQRIAVRLSKVRSR